MVYRTRTKWKGKQKPWTAYLEKPLVEFLKKVRKKELPEINYRWKAPLLRKIIIEWAIYKGYTKRQLGVIVKKPGPKKEIKRSRGRPRLFLR